MKVHELLATPEKWTQNAFARDKIGYETPSCSVTACRWCLLGAVTHCYQHHSPLIMDLLRAKLNDSVTRWNDKEGRTHQEVLAIAKELDI